MVDMVLHLIEIQKLAMLDVLNDYISLQTAKKVYGVIINDKEMKVDIKATQALRKKMK